MGKSECECCVCVGECVKGEEEDEETRSLNKVEVCTRSLGSLAHYSIHTFFIIVIVHIHPSFLESRPPRESSI